MKNKKSLYQLIIDNRYIISIIMIILATIYGFFRNSMSITQWLFTLDKVNSLWWNIKFYALLLASYELFLIITDNKKNWSNYYNFFRLCSI